MDAFNTNKYFILAEETNVFTIWQLSKKNCFAISTKEAQVVLCCGSISLKSSKNK